MFALLFARFVYLQIYMHEHYHTLAEAFSGHGVKVPSTPGTLWCWIRGDDLGHLLHLTRPDGTIPRLSAVISPPGPSPSDTRWRQRARITRMVDASVLPCR